MIFVWSLEQLFLSRSTAVLSSSKTVIYSAALRYNAKQVLYSGDIYDFLINRKNLPLLAGVACADTCAYFFFFCLGKMISFIVKTSVIATALQQ